MAQFRKRQRENPLAAFRSPMPSWGQSPAPTVYTGGAFDFLASAAATAYEQLDPLARRAAEEEGLKAGREAAEGTTTDVLTGKGGPRTRYPGVGRDRSMGDTDLAFDGEGADARSMGEGGLTFGKTDFTRGLTEAANRLKVSPEDLLTVMLYETGGTLDPLQPGPVTQWGQHRGLIQFGEPQAQQYGVDFSSPEAALATQLGADGGIVKYLLGSGFKPGMGFLDLYSTINAGSPGRYGASDENNGGAPGSVADKVESANMQAHRQRARAILAGEAEGSGAEPIVMVRTESGKLEPRSQSIFSNEYDRIYDAAASQAYLSGMLVQAKSDMMDLSSANPLNPDGFRSAADTYIEKVVESAPEFARQDLVMAMEEERDRRWLGMREEKQTDIRRRANNSSRALVERYSAEYAELLAAGDEQGAAAARQRLDSTLRAREMIPGVGWTPEQSQNVVIKATEEADRVRAARAREQEAEIGDFLSDVAKLAKDGMTHEDETRLQDPAVQAHPDYEEALVMTHLRDTGMPTFRRLNLAGQDAAIESARGQIDDDFDATVVKKLEEQREESFKALQNDPVGYAQEVGGFYLGDGSQPVPPPPLPDLTTGDPGAFQSALVRRHQWAAQAVKNGYTDELVLLSEEEADSIGELLKGDMPPEAKVAMSGMLVSAWGPDAAAAFRQMDVDTVTRYAGLLQASGNDRTAIDALRGQEKIDENVVRLPSASREIAAVSVGIAEAMAALPNGMRAQREVMDLASALYANEAHAKGIEPDSEEGKALYEESLQRALGQSKNARGVLMGGVQDVTLSGVSHAVMLPPDVTADMAATALSTAVRGPALNRAERRDGEAPAYSPEAWMQAGGAEPYFGDQTLHEAVTQGNLDMGDVRMVAIGNDMYRLEVGEYDVTGPDGTVFAFSLQGLIKGTR